MEFFSASVLNMIDVNKYNMKQLLNILRDAGIEDKLEEEDSSDTKEEAIIIPINTLRRLKSQKFYFEPVESQTEKEEEDIQ